MRVLITGGTGTVGSLLTEKLLNQGNSVVVLTRRKKTELLAHENLQYIEGNPQEYGSWIDKLTDIDGVVNLAGENILNKRWTQKQKEKIINSRVKTGETISRAIKEGKIKPKVVVSVSGTDFYPADRTTKSYTETEPPGGSFLSSVCEAWEKPFVDLDEPVRTVILRLGLIFTRQGKGGERMFIPHRFFVGGWIGSGKQIYSWIHQEDVVGILFWALTNENVSGIYNGVSPQPMPMKDIAVIGGKIIGRWTWTWLPGFVLRMLLGERADVLLKGRAVSSHKIEEAGYSFMFPTVSQALNDIL